MTSEGREFTRASLLVLASLVVTVALVRAGRSSERLGPRLERAPLAFGASAAACESCHPRHAAEWRRSVMAHAVSSPMFQSLELLVQEQVGRDADCPEGAGVLRRSDAATACRDRVTGRTHTGAGGEGWCVNCHAPGVNLGARLPSWDAQKFGPDNRPLAELLGAAGLDGIGCTSCHQVHGPASAGPGTRGEYQGNPSWISVATGARFDSRANAFERRFGIANSGYRLEPTVLLADGATPEALVSGGAHRRIASETREYLRSSEFCGSCHDVRLFGTDVLGAGRGESWKRLRNGYSEWREYAEREEAEGRRAPSCQDGHMSSFPGVCVRDAAAARMAEGERGGCPPGSRFEARAPGSYPLGFSAAAVGKPRPIHPHYFTGVEVPLDSAFEAQLGRELLLDPAGIPVGGETRSELLLRRSVRFGLGVITRSAGRISVPVTIENIAAGHRVPGGFSQERELWVHLQVTDDRGRVLYEVGRVDRADQDLADKRFLLVNTRDDRLDERGRPLGLFGADVADGVDAPRWQPPPELGGTTFRGHGLINFQNGFLRCVRCIGQVAPDGGCDALPGQERARGDRFADGDYDPDTGACDSNLFGRRALFETYFPIGALDATRGLVKAPDAILESRSLAPNTPVTYVYELDIPAVRPLHVEARLLFRAFPPYLVRAFAEYEAERQRKGRRLRGPLVTLSALERLRVIELGRVNADAG
jgi:hypothetical protein